MTHHPHDPDHDAITVLFRGAKGGVGTSTVAALHALALARAGAPTTLTATSAVQLADLAALLAIPAVDDTHIDVNSAANLAPCPTARAAIVIDGGTDVDPELAVSEHYLVIRSCYLTLRRAVGSVAGAQGIVLVAEPERPLTAADVEDVLGLPVVATVAVQAATARLIDAGRSPSSVPTVSPSSGRGDASTATPPPGWALRRPPFRRDGPRTARALHRR